MADLAELADDGVGVGEEIVADPGAFVDHDMGMQHGVSTDDGVLAHDGKRSDGWVLADGCAGGDGGERMDSRRGFGRLIEQLERAGEIEIGVG